MDIQRVRNLTTGRLHTEMGHIYEDMEYLTGMKVIMTHMLPNICRALEPYLRGQILDSRFWEDKYDTSHTGTIDIRPMNDEEQKAFLERYSSLKSPLEGKDVIVLATQPEHG